MKTLANVALTIGAATLLAVCGGAQPPIGVPGSTPRPCSVTTALLATVGLAILAATVGANSPVPVPVGFSEQLSGSATIALVHAYHASGIDDKSPIPFRLAPYVVTIGRTDGGHYEVQFWSGMTNDHRGLYVQGKAGAVIPWSQLTDLVSVDELVLPGITAGAIIAAYDKALSDPEISPSQATLLTEGAYNLNYSPASGSTYVAFIWLSAPPAVLSLAAAPTPPPSVECSRNGCNDRFAYFVDHRNGRFRVWNAARIP